MSNILVVVGGDTRCSLVICVMIRGDFADIGPAIEQQPALCHGARLNLSLDHRSHQPPATTSITHILQPNGSLVLALAAAAGLLAPTQINFPKHNFKYSVFYVVWVPQYHITLRIENARVL